MASRLVELILSLNAQGLIGPADQSRAAIKKLDNEFRSLQSSAAGALSFAGIGIGAAALINLADAYGQMSARLRLATQYSNDFDETQQMLRDSSRSTRSDLIATVDLYSKMAPALKGIGLNAAQSVGVVTTINQAIALSGGSAESAAAALVQLGQGFASGVLRGEELNSVMEQTPALARAIADGLGVPIGELRKLGEEGKLTAEAVAKALQNVAQQVEADFRQVPATVGQAMTALKNEFLVFVGATDQASGSTSALAQGIMAVADEFREAGPAVTAFVAVLKTLMAGLDGSYRLLKVLGAGLGAYTAAVVAFLSGDLGRAKTILDELGGDVQAILEKPLLANPFEDSDRKVVTSAENTARKRAQLEEQLTAQKKRLAELRAYEEGKAIDNVAAKDKANVDARIADQKRLVDAVRKAWQDSLAEAEKASQDAQKKLDKAADIRSAGEKAQFDVGLEGLTPEDQLAVKQARYQQLAGDAEAAARDARIAALKGDAKAFDVASAAAEKKLSAALDMAREIKDVTAIGSITDLAAGVQEEGARMDQRRAAETKQVAEAQAQTLASLQAELDKLQQKARSIEVEVDVSKAQSAIAGLQQKLADMAKGTTVPVTVAPTTAPVQDAEVPQFAYGGWTGPGGKFQPAGIVHANEFVTRSEVVRQPGALAFLSRFNDVGMRALRGYSSGGLVSSINPGALSSASLSGRSGRNLTLVLGSERFGVSAGDDVIGRLEDHVAREALRKGGRR